MADKDRLNSLKERLVKSTDEAARLKEAIAKEEKRLREKAKRDNEKWWRDLSRKQEIFLTERYGNDYKKIVTQELLFEILCGSDKLPPFDGKEMKHDICEHTDRPGECGSDS